MNEHTEDQTKTASIKGIKSSEFRSPREFMEGEGSDAGSLPEGIRLYMRGKAIDFRGKDLKINIYRLVSGMGTKDRKDLAGRWEGNTVPDDHDVAMIYGPGRYVWIAKWTDPVHGEKGMVSDEIHVAEDMRAAHLEYRRKNGMASPGVDLAPVAAPSHNLADPLSVLQLIQLGENRQLENMERILKLVGMRPGGLDMPASADTQKQALKIMSDAYERRIKMLEEEKPKEAEPVKTEDEVPGFLKPFMPMIEKALPKLLGGGPAAAGIREFVLSDEDFKAIFNDPAQFGEAVKALQTKFGPERAERALQALLGEEEVKDETIIEKMAGRAAAKVAKAGVRMVAGKKK